MRRRIFILLLISFVIFNFSCNDRAENQSSRESKKYISDDEVNDPVNDGYKDGTYCADVEYYNPSTSTRSTYDLDVEVEDGELTLIHWPNTGWLDKSHFSPEDITSGVCEFKSDKGYHYTVILGENGGCGYTDEYKIRRDVNNEVEKTTCPKCGGGKDGYDDYCNDCQDKIEHTCKRCGQVDNLMFSTDDYCSDCEDKLENSCSRCGSNEYGINGGLCSNCKNEND